MFAFRASTLVASFCALVPALAQDNFGSSCQGNGECSSGYCRDLGTFIPTGRCVHQPGEACGSDLDCPGQCKASGVCAQVNAGSCTSSYDCADGTACNDYTTTSFPTRTCGGAGAYCTNDGQCASPQGCNTAQNYCYTVTANDDCSSTDDYCSPRNACAPDMKCRTGPGQFCNTFQPCAFGPCIGNRCGTEGIMCTATDQCGFSPTNQHLTCSSAGVCKRSTGDVCTENTQCASAYCSLGLCAGGSPGARSRRRSQIALHVNCPAGTNPCLYRTLTSSSLECLPPDTLEACGCNRESAGVDCSQTEGADSIRCQKNRCAIGQSDSDPCLDTCPHIGSLDSCLEPYTLSADGSACSVA